jgi:glycerol-3-phosphate acyltransferase PlsX
VALDGHGADHGPGPLLEGAGVAAAEGIPVKLFGAPGTRTPAGVELVACERWIPNDADPVASVRSTPEASIVRASAAVASGEASAVVSAGSTGATMTAALFALKRGRGVHRPALAAQVPVPVGDQRAVLFLDVGANTEVRPQHLIQFAFLGSAFSRAVLSVAAPRVALLSVGEEQKKGSPDVVAAHEALAASSELDFVGNVEGRDLLTGVADVIVTDGFTGNVTLKTLEGTARAVAEGVRTAARSGLVAAAGGLLLRPALGPLRRRMDPNEVGGAILLGLRGVAVVAHGSSSAEGIANAIRLADRSVRERAVERTAELLRASGASREGLRASDRGPAGPGDPASPRRHT